MKFKRLIAIAITIVMVLSSASAIFAEDTVLMPLDNASKLTSMTSTWRDEVIAAIRDSVEDYESDDIVNVMIELESDALIDIAGSDTAEYAATAAGKKALSSIKAYQNKIKDQIKSKFDVSLDDSYSYTAVINAFTAAIRYSDMRAIEALDGVKRVFVSGTIELSESNIVTPDYIGSSETINADALNNTGYTGKGIVIAIIDDGLSYDHEAFSVMPDEADLKITTDEMASIQSSLSNQLNSGGNGVVINSKVIYAYDYAGGDSNVKQPDNHGTHVSGIAAGNNGTDFYGIAPDAQIMAMKAFPDNSASTNTAYGIAALEDAILLGADIINMSFGIPSGFSSYAYEAFDEIFERAEAAGVILSCSAGNNNNVSEGQSAYDLPYAETPDYGMVSASSTFSMTLSVACAENPYVWNSVMRVGDIYINYYENEGAASFDSVLGKAYKYVYCGLGTLEEIAEAGAAGKVALISRGVSTFQEKIDNAAASGAVAAIIMNNVPDELINMQIEGCTIPAAFITLGEGEYMIDAEDKTVYFESDLLMTINEYGGYMTSYSNWGPTSELVIKPEITAVGGNVLSSVNDNEYASMSGTSMSAPAISGACAVLMQYLDETQPELSRIERAELVINLMMSTADQLYDENGMIYSPRKQGAGLLNLLDCISTGSYITTDSGRPKASVGSNTNGVFRYTFTVKNISDTGIKYALDTKVITDQAVTDGEDLYSYLMSRELTAGKDYTIMYRSTGKLSSYIPVEDSDDLFVNIGEYGVAAKQGEKGAVTYVDVPAGRSVNVTVTIKLTASAKKNLDEIFENGIYIEGYTCLSSKKITDVSLPFLGFYGDWASLDLFDNTVYEGDSYYYEGALITVFGNDISYDALGLNYFTGEYDPENIAYTPYYAKNRYGDYSAAYLSSTMGLLRNAENVTFAITDPEGRVMEEFYYGRESKTYYSEYPMSLDNVGFLYGEWDTIMLAEGDYTYTVTAETTMGNVQTKSIDFYVDNTSPQLLEGGFAQIDGERYFVASSVDNRASQGTLLNLYIGEETISADDMLEIAYILYSGGVFDEELLMQFIDTAPLAEAVDYGENGYAETYINISRFEEFVDLCNEHILPLLGFDDGTEFESDAFVIYAIDYAWNVSDAYLINN